MSNSTSRSSRPYPMTVHVAFEGSDDPVTDDRWRKLAFQFLLSPLVSARVFPSGINGCAIPGE